MGSFNETHCRIKWPQTYYTLSICSWFTSVEIFLAPSKNSIQAKLIVTLFLRRWPFASWCLRSSLVDVNIWYTSKSWDFDTGLHRSSVSPAHQLLSILLKSSSESGILGIRILNSAQCILLIHFFLNNIIFRLIMILLHLLCVHNHIHCKSFVPITLSQVISLSWSIRHLVSQLMKTIG